MGELHRDDCVLLRRPVVIRVTMVPSGRPPLTFELTAREPASRSARDIEFHYNDSSWCSGNIVLDVRHTLEENPTEELWEVYEKLREIDRSCDDLDGRPHCLCSITMIRVVSMGDEIVLDEAA